MKITIQDIGPGEEEEIIVRCRDLDEALLRMIHELKRLHARESENLNRKLREYQQAERSMG